MKGGKSQIFYRAAGPLLIGIQNKYLNPQRLESQGALRYTNVHFSHLLENVECFSYKSVQKYLYISSSNIL